MSIYFVYKKTLPKTITYSYHLIVNQIGNFDIILQHNERESWLFLFTMPIYKAILTIIVSQTHNARNSCIIGMSDTYCEIIHTGNFIVVSKKLLVFFKTGAKKSVYEFHDGDIFISNCQFLSNWL